MLKIMDHPSPAAEKALGRIAGRGLVYSRTEYAAVNRILEDVRRRGDRALVDYTRRFDCPGFAAADLPVGKAEMAAARSAVGRDFLRALDRAARGMLPCRLHGCSAFPQFTAVSTAPTLSASPP